jgi:hypothetical protein
MLDRCSYHLSHSASPFFVCVMGFFRIGSPKLLPRSGFEPWSLYSASWVVRITGLTLVS